MSDNADLVKSFIDITGASEDRAKFYLESANNELQTALSSFFEGDGEDVPPPPVSRTPMDLDSDDDDEPAVVESKPQEKSSKGKAKKTKASNIATLNMLNDSSDEEEEQGQAFYAGGSERSGQQVLGPPKKNPIKDYVSEIFRSAQQGNVETYEPEDGPRAGASLYAGTGYKLGENESDHVAIPSGSSKAGGSGGASKREVVTLTLWRQGFSINDGELRPYDDPANKEFCECITRGEIPEELRGKGLTMIHLDLKDNRHEDYVKRAPEFKAFTGSGHLLGSPTPNFVSTTLNEGNKEDNEKKATGELKLDESQPTTMLQIRLADGTRLSSRFNHTHTVADVRRYIINARPQFSAQSFALLTTFPSKELTEENKSLKEAGLLNAAIMQRMK